VDTDQLLARTPRFELQGRRLPEHADEPSRHAGLRHTLYRLFHLHIPPAPSERACEDQGRTLLVHISQRWSIDILVRDNPT
jgi:hypothetical protein